jgi:hypothetical protein
LEHPQGRKKASGINAYKTPVSKENLSIQASPSFYQNHPPATTKTQLPSSDSYPSNPLSFMGLERKHLKIWKLGVNVIWGYPILGNSFKDRA